MPKTRKEDAVAPEDPGDTGSRTGFNDKTSFWWCDVTEAKLKWNVQRERVKDKGLCTSVLLLLLWASFTLNFSTKTNFSLFSLSIRSCFVWKMQLFSTTTDAAATFDAVFVLSIRIRYWINMCSDDSSLSVEKVLNFSRCRFIGYAKVNVIHADRWLQKGFVFFRFSVFCASLFTFYLIGIYGLKFISSLSSFAIRLLLASVHPLCAHDFVLSKQKCEFCVMNI